MLGLEEGESRGCIIQLWKFFIKLPFHPLCNCVYAHIIIIIIIMQVLGGTALYHAAVNGDVEIVRVLLEGGADMEIKAEANIVHLFL